VILLYYEEMNTPPSLTGSILLPCQAFCCLLERKMVMIVAYSGTAFTKEEQRELVIDAIAVLLGDYNITRKYAAVLILKAFLPTKVRRAILEDDAIYPFDRNDYRVKKWTESILSRGVCEVCGSKEHLEAHHIIKWADYPKGRADINNGECLCHSCHTMRHVGDQSYYLMKSKKYK
jgi:hypothetical protein